MRRSYHLNYLHVIYLLSPFLLSHCFGCCVPWFQVIVDPVNTQEISNWTISYTGVYCFISLCPWISPVFVSSFKIFFCYDCFLQLYNTDNWIIDSPLFIRISISAWTQQSNMALYKSERVSLLMTVIEPFTLWYTFVLLKLVNYFST